MPAARDVEDGETEESQKQSWMMQEVTESWGDLILLACVFISGLLDAAIFNVWSCFIGMQTGTTRSLHRYQVIMSLNMGQGILYTQPWVSVANL
jgi:hypothetical protein